MLKLRNVLLKISTCCILLLSWCTYTFAESFAGDTIRPVFVEVPMDLSLSCDVDGSGTQFLLWYQLGASGVSLDNGDTVAINATISFQEALALLNESDPSCSGQGNVDVGFFGIDSCGNTTLDTLMATFSIIDDMAPIVTVEPLDRSVICNNASDDILTAWINIMAEAQLDDNCIDDLIVSYIWVDNNGESGTGLIGDAVDIPITREQCGWNIDVIFSASDGCGNAVNFSANFEVVDQESPGYFPELEDETVNCFEGLPAVSDVDAVDACDGILEYIVIEESTQDPDSTNCGHFNYSVSRTFSSTDFCGNVGNAVQTIFVQDTTAPILVLPDTIMIDCEEFNLNNPDSFLDIYEDLCSDVLVTFGQTDLEVELCEFTVRREWSVRDRCSNIATASQIIIVSKSVPPTLETESEDLFIACDTLASYNAVLQDWLDDLGGASTNSSCSVVNSFAAIPGSYDAADPSTFPGSPITIFNLDSCSGFELGFAHSLAVDFVFYTDCGNTTISHAFAHVVDDQAPNFITICNDTLNFQIVDTCGTDITIVPPSLVDNCGELESPKVLEITKDVTSSSPGDVSAVVDSMLFRFESIDLINIIPAGEFIIEVTLDNIDGDDPFELFEIKDENGIVLDTTPNTFNQCGDTSLVINNISTGVFNFWALDGTVDVWVVPIGTGSLAVNDVCLESFVTVSLSYEINVSSNVQLSYSIDLGPQTQIEIGEEIPLSLDAGIYEIEYQAIDCGNNVTTCSEFINIRDGSPPSVNCPSDITLQVENISSCEASYFFSDTITVMDDCGLSPGDSLRYFTIGATEKDLTTIKGNLDFVILTGGLTTCFLIAVDASGNSDTCSFNLFVEDNIMPIANCQNITQEVHPGSLVGLVLDPEDLNDGSEDLCGNLTFELSDSILSCNLLNMSTEVLLTVTDASGNFDQCTSQVILESMQLDPLVSFGMCDGDTLYLLPNLADTIAGFNYSYNWSGPDGYVSVDESPVIVNADETNVGEYSLEIIGEGGCTATGSVLFNFDNIEMIQLSSDALVYCENEAATLSVETLNGVSMYNWYEGDAPNGSLITQTSDPRLTVFPSIGQHTYYVQVDLGFCLSSVSEHIEISVQEPPVASIAAIDGIVCTGDDLTIEVMNPQIGVDYEWYKQGALQSEDAELILENITLADAGEYKLIAKIGPCVSDSTRILVAIITGFETPIISGENVYCEGSTITLNVENEPNGSIYSWLLNGMPFITNASNTLTVVNANPAFTGLWQVYTENFNCISDTSATFQISVEEEIEIGASNNGPACTGGMVTLSATFLPGSSYNWTAPDDEVYTGQEVTVPAIAGLYTLTVMTIAGCESNAFTFVEVNEAPTVTAVSNTSSSCMVLGDTISFVASVFPPGEYEYEWSGPNGVFSTDSIAMITNFASGDNGSYCLIVYNDNCPSNKGTTQIEAQLIPPKPDIIQLSGFCKDEALGLLSSTDQAGASYVWTTPSGEITTDVPDLTLPTGGLQINGFYNLVISLDGCDSPQSDTLTVFLEDKPNDPEILAVLEICEGDDLVLTSIEEAEFYIWEGLISTVTSVPEVIIEDISGGGIVSLTLQNGGCESDGTDQIEITVAAFPDPPIANIDNIPSCLTTGETVEICIENFIEGITYLALNVEGAELVIFDNPCFVIDNQLLTDGANVISIFSEDDGCRSPEGYTLIVNSVSSNFSGAEIEQDDMALCDNNEISITAVNVPSGAEIEWTSNDEELVLVPQDNMVAISNIQDGENVIILTTSIGTCEDLSRDTIILTSLFGVKANDDIVVIEPNESRNIDVISNDIFGQGIDVTIIGQPVVGTAFVDDNHITYIPPSGYVGEVSIIYEICELDCPNFCSRSVLVIQVGDPSNCMVPTVITPNDDGVNDAFVIPCLDTNEHLNNQIIIFNQWGDEVFSANPYKNDWKGTYSEISFLLERTTTFWIW